MVLNMAKCCFKFGKIIRDQLVDAMQDSGITVYQKELHESEVLVELKKKLLEEVEEVVGSQNEKELLAELGDVLEVVKALASFYGNSLSSVIELAAKKAESKGGFKKHAYVEYIEISESHPHFNYYKKQPKKYPEILP